MVTCKVPLVKHYLRLRKNFSGGWIDKVNEISGFSGTSLDLL
jgi:hypothetical protein